MNAYRENKLTQALDYFDQILKLHPNNLDAILFKDLTEWKMIQYNLFS